MRRYSMIPLILLVSAAASAQAPPISPTPSLTVDDQIHLSPGSAVFKGDALFLWNDSGGNTALGAWALSSDTTGSGNTAVGLRALFLNQTGTANTANGVKALLWNETGSNNTAIGASALYISNGNSNTATGLGALMFNVEGSYNTATGSAALLWNYGSHNTAVGYSALQGLSTTPNGNYNSAVGSFALLKGGGWRNVGLGAEALRNHTAGSDNTAVGHAALRDNTTGGQNTALGQAALLENEIGSYNTAVGEDALRYATGSNNIALGRWAGRGLKTSGSNNIFIGSEGALVANNAIVLGNEGTHMQTFIAGIKDTTLVATHFPVYIDTSNGQLGKPSSSRRSKEDIADVGEGSEPILALRPVRFRYKTASRGGEKPVQFGLIAEEVAEVFPELVVFDPEGRAETVKYHLLSSLLLNELQREHRLNREQAAEIGRLRARLERLETTEPRDRQGGLRGPP